VTDDALPWNEPTYVHLGDVQGVIVANDSVVYSSAPWGTASTENITTPCRVYWGSHGCHLERGHDGHCRCECADLPPEPDVINVGTYPYYGDETLFYGEDAIAKWGPERVHRSETS
jgi:hypothetical protein